MHTPERRQIFPQTQRNSGPSTTWGRGRRCATFLHAHTQGCFLVGYNTGWKYHFPISSFSAGPFSACYQYGLASFVPANIDLTKPRLFTYLEAKGICKAHGMALSNKLDPWTRSCEEPFKKYLRFHFGNLQHVQFWDNNDVVREPNALHKAGIICTYLNFPVNYWVSDVCHLSAILGYERCEVT